MLRPLLRGGLWLLGKAIDDPLLAETPWEAQMAAALREQVRSIPAIDPSGLLPSDAAWAENVLRLRELVLTRDPREFLRWDVVERTMFVGYASWINTELAWLKQRPDWKTRWRDAIGESSVGRPSRFAFYPRSSANLIHHAYHLAQFERQTGVSVSSLRQVVEFGGGYGSLCRLYHKLGFSGRYVIFDLPEFSALQRFYVASLGMRILSSVDCRSPQPGVACITNREELKTAMRDCHPDASMFVATWSISEASGPLRDFVLPVVAGSGAFLLAYQHQFREMDNLRYFARWKKSLGRVTWYEWEIPHLRGNNYLIGSALARL